MKTENKVFFAIDKGVGITQTSANHIANIAKEMAQKLREEIGNLNLVTSKVELLSGTGEPKILKQEMDVERFSLLMTTVLKIGQYDSLIAWLREAIKAKENELKYIDHLSFEAWAKLTETTLPVCPSKTDFGGTTFEEQLGLLSIKERNNYLYLETQCAVIGKLIHPDGALSNARKEYQKRLTEQNTIGGSGRDAVITTYTTSIPSEDVEKVFFDLQNTHREYQATLNKMKFDIEQEEYRINTERDDVYNKAYVAYNAAFKESFNAYTTFKDVQRNEIGKLKIVIPEALANLFMELNEMGK